MWEVYLLQSLETQMMPTNQNAYYKIKSFYFH